MPFPDLLQPDLGAYQSGVVTPVDFVAFWEQTLAEARAIGGVTSLTPVATGFTALEAFDVSFPGFGGHPVKGWLVLPKHREARLPLVCSMSAMAAGVVFRTNNCIGRRRDMPISGWILGGRGVGGAWGRRLIRWGLRRRFRG